MKRSLVRLLAAGGVGLVLTAGLVTRAEPPPLDRGKAAIEAPAKRVIASRTGPAPAAAGAAFVNPKVQPGKVRWHTDFDAACRAAARSGKPVLVFQMMGRLDEKFC